MPDLEYDEVIALGRVIPVSLVNYSSSATPSPHVQLIRITDSFFHRFVSSLLSWENVPFHVTFIDPNTNTIIPSWYEWFDGTWHYWRIKISNSISANSTYKIYMVIDPYDNLINGSTVGINSLWCSLPWYGSSCSQYDNGANIFMVYTNFVNGIPSGWTVKTLTGSFTPTPTTISTTANILGTLYQVTIPALYMMNNSSYTSVALIYNSSITTTPVTIELNAMYNGAADNFGIGYLTQGPQACNGGYEPASAGGYYAGIEFYAGTCFIDYNSSSCSYSTYSSVGGCPGQGGPFYTVLRLVVTSSGASLYYLPTSPYIYLGVDQSRYIPSASYSGSPVNPGSTFYVASDTGGYSSYQYFFMIRLYDYTPSVSAIVGV